MFSKFTKPETNDGRSDDTIREVVNYRPLSDTKFGLNLAFAGAETTGKSLLMTAVGYFNSKYVNRLDKEKYPYSIQLLKGGYMPEVEEIFILDLDNSFEKSCSRGTFSDLIKPLKPIIKVEEICLPSRQSKIVDGQITEARSEELFRMKNKAEDCIQSIVKDNRSEVLFGIDSMSSYYEILNSMFSVVYEATFDKTMYSKVEKQADWQIRNAWWSETMKKKRKFAGWQVDTIKAVLIPPHFRKTEASKQNPYSLKWAEGSGDNAFNLDQVYWIKRDAEGFPFFDTVKCRYGSSIMQENCGLYYPLKKRTAIFAFIEQMAPYIVEGVSNEEELW